MSAPVLLVAYYALLPDHPEKECANCPDRAWVLYNALATPGLTGYLCHHHAAEHMRMNAYAIDSDPDTERPEGLSPMSDFIADELDRFERGEETT